jgi:hypothetical protein
MNSGRWLDVQLHLPKLSLSVVVTHVPDGYWLMQDQLRRNITIEEARKVMNMYRRMLSPLSKLKDKGLESFSLTVADAYAWKPITPRPDEQDRFLKRDLGFQRFVRRLEHLVMGKDYDSSFLQERAHGPSGCVDQA